MSKSANHLGTTLKRLMEQNRISGPDIQKRTGLDRSILSRLKHGKQITLKPVSLAAICDVLGQNAHEKAELIAAHLLDVLEASGPGRELVRVIIAGDTKSGSTKEHAIEYTNKVAPSDKRTIERLIAKIPSNPAISDSLKNLDKLTGEL